MTESQRLTRRAKGEGSVFWNSEKGRWQGLIDLGYGSDGHRDRKKVTGKTKTEVVKRLAELRRQVDGGVDVQTADQTLGAFVDEWAATLEATRTLRPTTIDSYRWILGKYVTDDLRAIPLRKLTPQRLRLWMKTLASPERARPLSSRTISLARTVLGAALKQAVRDGLVLNNPIDAVERPRRDDAGEPKALTAHQASKLLEQTNDPMIAAFIALAIGCGLRRGEAIGLQWDDLDLDAMPPMLTVRRSVSALGGSSIVQSPKTRAGRRQVIVPAFTGSSLLVWRAAQFDQQSVAGSAWERREPGWVFTSSIGTAVDPANLSKRVVAVGRIAGLELSPHALRHTYVTLALNAGAPIGVISKAAGHSTIAVTSDIYGSLQVEGQQLVAGAIETVLRTQWS